MAKEILIWKHIESETIKDYKYLKTFQYKCVTLIKRRLCSDTLTMRPKLEASQELKKIVSRLTQTTEKNFAQKLDD